MRLSLLLVGCASLVLFSVRPVTAQKEIPLKPITVSVDDGTFIFDPLALTRERYGTSYNLIGTITNKTSKNWNRVAFTLDVLDVEGKPFETLVRSTLLVVGPLKQGESAKIEELLFSLHDQVPASVLLKFESGDYPANYTFVMVKPKPSTELVYQDAFVSFTFSLAQRTQLEFEIRNKTINPVKIDWNQVAYIDPSNESHKVIHQGVKYSNKAEVQAPTIVPPTAKLSDIVLPIDYVSFYSTEYLSGWHKRSFFPDGPLARLLKDATFSVFIPLEINGQTKNYLFTFKIANVQM